MIDLIETLNQVTENRLIWYSIIFVGTIYTVLHGFASIIKALRH